MRRKIKSRVAPKLTEAITAIHLSMTARIPGIEQSMFDTIAQKAKSGCPVSKVLNATITLEATLHQ